MTRHFATDAGQTCGRVVAELHTGAGHEAAPAEVVEHLNRGLTTGSTPQARTLEDPMADSHDGTCHSNRETCVQHRSLCPCCGRLAVRETHKISITGLRTSVYHCTSAHLWETRWTEVS